MEKKLSPLCPRCLKYNDDVEDSKRFGKLWYCKECDIEYDSEGNDIS